jgi:hypothetical protein
VGVALILQVKASMKITTDAEWNGGTGVTWNKILDASGNLQADPKTLVEENKDGNG